MRGKIYQKARPAFWRGGNNHFHSPVGSRGEGLLSYTAVSHMGADARFWLDFGWFGEVTVHRATSPRVLFWKAADLLPAAVLLAALQLVVLGSSSNRGSPPLHLPPLLDILLNLSSRSWALMLGRPSSSGQPSTRLFMGVGGTRDSSSSSPSPSPRYPRRLSPGQPSPSCSFRKSLTIGRSFFRDARLFPVREKRHDRMSTWSDLQAGQSNEHPYGILITPGDKNSLKTLADFLTHLQY